MNKIRHWVKFRMPDNPREKTLIRVSLSPRGVIGLNRPAHRVLGEAPTVVLLFDAVDHLIGIRPADEGEEHAVPLHPRARPSGGAYVHAIKFCHLNRIPTRRTIAFNNIEIDDETTLVLNLHDTPNASAPRPKDSSGSKAAISPSSVSRPGLLLSVRATCSNGWGS